MLVLSGTLFEVSRPMADRTVSKAEEDFNDPLVIDDVKVLKTVTVSDENPDSFSRSAEDLKSMDGVGPVLKRRVSNQMKKFRAGADGAESKRIDEESFLSGYSTFEVVEPPYNIDYLAKLYEMSSPHYSAVNAKVSNVVGLGFKLVETSKTKRVLEDAAKDEKKVKSMRRKLDIHREEMLDLIDSLNEEEHLTEILTKVWRDYEVTGNGYIEVGRKRDGTIGYLGHIPAQTVRVRKKRDGFVQISGFKVEFFANFGRGDVQNPVAGSGTPNEIIHIKRYSPTSGYYGVPDIIAAKQAIAGNEFAARFNLDYFENKAVPRHLIVLKGAKLGDNAQRSLLSFFETGLKGQNHRSLYIPLPADTSDSKVSLDIKPVEAGIQDSSFNNYRKANLSDILMAHRVPITKVSVAEGASLAVARDADKTFKEQVIGPEQDMLEKKLNRVIKELTDAYVLDLEEMTLTDEDTQSKIDERRRKTGNETANEQRTRRGMPTIEGGDELFDMNGKSSTASEQRSEATTNRERDSRRSAGATDSAGEARNPQGEGRTSE